MPGTNANCEVTRMQYHNWDVIIILTLNDTLPFYNNFCSYMLGNAIFVTESQCVLLFAVECTCVKDCIEKSNYFTFLPKLQINSCMLNPSLDYNFLKNF